MLFIAFLRAINVGGHVVKMDRLRVLFAELGFSAVETFIASGNVIFETPSADAPALEQQIERHMRPALGYEVATFLRTPAEVTAVGAYQPFDAAELAAVGSSLHVGFLRAAPPAAAQEKLLDLRTPTDDFHTHGRELYWLRRAPINESRITGALLEKTLGMPATLRNVTTVRRLAAKYPTP
jgi:uncharacterized protein (DUF1697 family)